MTESSDKTKVKREERRKSLRKIKKLSFQRCLMELSTHLNLYWTKILQMQLPHIIFGHLEEMLMLESLELCHIKEALFYSYLMRFQKYC